MDTIQRSINAKKRRTGFFASYEDLAETIETNLGRGEMQRLYSEYTETTESQEHGFSGFPIFLDLKQVYYRRINGRDRHQVDESVLIA